jgi:cytochrome c-type biogenesis protein CcmH
MLLFICFAVLAAAVTWAVTRPLWSEPSAASLDNDPELAVYRDQLATIERERDEGLIGAAEAEAARVEVARRLIKHAEESAPAAAARAQPRFDARVALGLAAALPVLAVVLYLGLGQPGLPGRPYSARLTSPIDRADVNDLIAKVEKHLRDKPNDGPGWDVLAPVYMRMGEFQEASDAYAQAIRLLGESPQRLSGFARAMVMQQNGIVDERARKAFEKLRTLEPDSVEPKVWLAIAREQDGDLAGAAGEYRALLALPGIQDPWKSLLQERVRLVAAKLGQPVPPEAAAPAGKDAPAASRGAPDVNAMTPEQREAFVTRMVDGLAERLKSNGKDLEGWLRLVRAYAVLGRKEDATAALSTARSNFAGDTKALGELDELADTLGLRS